MRGGDAVEVTSIVASQGPTHGTRIGVVGGRRPATTPQPQQDEAPRPAATAGAKVAFRLIMMLRMAGVASLLYQN